MRKPSLNKATGKAGKKPVKRRRGRPDHVPTDQTRGQVQILAIAGNKQEVIAMVVGISLPTLRKHYRRELDTAVPLATAAVVHNLHKIATSRGQGAVAAAIYWMKTHGWKESSREITGPEGAPIPIIVKKEDFDL